MISKDVDRSVRLATAVRRTAVAVAGRPERLCRDLAACARALQAAERLRCAMREHARWHPLSRKPGAALEAVGLKADRAVTHEAIDLLLSPERLAALLRELENDIELALGDEIAKLKCFLDEVSAQGVLRMLAIVDEHRACTRKIDQQRELIAQSERNVRAF